MMEITSEAQPRELLSRADGFQNIVTNPHVGLTHLVPGRGDTLRINGRARLVREAPFFYTTRPYQTG